MRSNQPQTPRLEDPDDRGFTMIELLVVVAVIVIMAAVAIPNIARFLRTYRVRGAATEIAGEIQAARNKAISKNANAAVVFTVLDSDSYRIYVPDLNPRDLVPPPPESRGAVKDLPQGMNFLPGRASATFPPVKAIGFDRLGRMCHVGDANCVPGGRVTDAILCPAADQPRCNNWTPGTYIEFPDAGALAGSAVVRLQERVTRQETTISVAPGGRVLWQRGGWR